VGLYSSQVSGSLFLSFSWGKRGSCKRSCAREERQPDCKNYGEAGVLHRIASNDESPDRCTGGMVPNQRSCSVGAAMVSSVGCPTEVISPRECWEMEMYGHVYKADLGKVILTGLC
jgi:hypothetical protein